MSHFPRLPVLETVVRQVAPPVRERLVRTAVVGVQHLLETTGSLVEALLELGVSPDHIVLVGKTYSTSEEVLAELTELGINAVNGGADIRRETPDFRSAIESAILGIWVACKDMVDRDEVDTIVVLDDGGRCIASAPDSLLERVTVIGVEQTTHGTVVIAGRTPMPVILVASSAIKRIVEPPLIAEKVVHALEEKLGALDDYSVGIIGLGNIGTALGEYLITHGVGCVGFDRKSNLHVEGMRITSTLSELISEATLILGCTGEDALADLEQGDSLAGKTLASCSSEDIEFQSLLMSNVPAVSHLADREIRVHDGTCLVLRGGFPINFDGARESLPSEQIQLTRGLLLSGVLQAVGCLRDEVAPGTEMLSPELQQLVLRTWRSSVGGGVVGSYPQLDSTTTIEELSGGKMRAPRCADLLLSGGTS